jgi:hypothetical protein
MEIKDLADAYLKYFEKQPETDLVRRRIFYWENIKDGKSPQIAEALSKLRQ